MICGEFMLVDYSRSSTHEFGGHDTDPRSKLSRYFKPGCLLLSIAYFRIELIVRVDLFHCYVWIV